MLADTFPILINARAHVKAKFEAGAGATSLAGPSGSAATGSSVALGYGSGSTTTSIAFNAANCPTSSASVFMSASLGVDVQFQVLQVTVGDLQPVKDLESSLPDIGGLVKSALSGFNAIVVVPAYPTTATYTNVLGGGTSGSMINLFSACVSVTVGRRLGEARGLAQAYSFDDTKTYAASQAAGGSSASEPTCTIPSGATISQAACTVAQKVATDSGFSASSVCTCSSGGSSSAALSGGAIAGIVIGVLAGVALIAVGGLYYAGKLPIGGGDNRKKPVRSAPGSSSAAKTVGGENPMARK